MNQIFGTNWNIDLMMGTDEELLQPKNLSVLSFIQYILIVV